MKKTVSVALFIALLFITTPGFPGDKPRKPAKADAQVVDSGSFGVYVSGRRVATESFQIQDRTDVKVATAELRTEEGKATQSYELQIMPNGDLRRYEWRELSPGKALTTVEPSEQFLIEKLTSEAVGAKPIELAFILPPSTQIVDDYFFSHRQILLWRYLAAGCAPSGDNRTCKLEKASFGVFVPRQQAPVTVALEYKGREKVALKGAETELDRFDLQSEDSTWSLWVDANYKLQRVVIAAENTEVLRD